MSYVIGIDIGGTNIVCGLLDEQYNLLGKVKQPTEAAKGSDHVFAKINGMIDQLFAETGKDRSKLIAVGAGTPGFIDSDRGVCLFAGNLGWRDLEVAKLLGEYVKVPVFIDNDVRMYVYGETIKGSVQGVDHVYGITLGTGLASGMVNDGKLYYGGGYMAGELGHVHVDGESTPCGCGMKGCLETIASATGIARQARERITQGEESVMQAWFPEGDLSGLTATHVSKAYDEGDRLAIDIMNYTGTVLGKALAYAITLFSPNALVIGGGAALAGERLFKPMREAIQANVYSGYWDKLSIHQGTLIDDGGLIGSAAFARSRV